MIPAKIGRARIRFVRILSSLSDFVSLWPLALLVTHCFTSFPMYWYLLSAIPASASPPDAWSAAFTRVSTASFFPASTSPVMISSCSASLMALQIFSSDSLSPSRSAVAWIASANSLPKISGLTGFLPSLATFTAASISPSSPFPVLATTGITGMPRAPDSPAQSILSPRSSTSSIMFIATTMGIPVSISCTVR